MKIIHTFWSGPNHKDEEINLLSTRGGWLSAEYHWMSWALSCLQAKEVFGNITLITDYRGKEILIDQLNLPYSTINTELEGLLDKYPKTLFGLAKISSYAMQTEPFIHIDGDVFIWHKPDESLLSTELIAQNLDKNLPFYLSALDEINENFSYIPTFFKKEVYNTIDLLASNAGILGGNNLVFFKEYKDLAFEFIDKNFDNFSKLNTGNLNFIFEQLLFCQLAMKKNIPINYIKGVVEDSIFKEYIKFEDFPHVQMVHPVGNFKKYEHVCNHLAKKLRKDYPKYYYRIIDIIKGEKVKMRSAIYYSPYLNRAENFNLIASNNQVEPFNGHEPFTRTKSAIKYLTEKLDLTSSAEIKNNIPDNNYIRAFGKLLSDESDKQRLAEIFELEKGYYLKNEELFGNEKTINTLYDEDVKTYKKIQDLFLLEEHEQLNAIIIRAKNCLLFELGWVWKYYFKEEIVMVIEHNFKEEKTSNPILLIPDVIQANMKELYFDQIEKLIYDNIEKKVSLKEIIAIMENYFEEDEIKEDYDSFKILIIKTIKRLLYAGALEIFI